MHGAWELFTLDDFEKSTFSYEIQFNAAEWMGEVVKCLIACFLFILQHRIIALLLDISRFRSLSLAPTQNNTNNWCIYICMLLSYLIKVIY